jgi:hypothetical protein
LTKHAAVLPHAHGLSPARSTTTAPPHLRPSIGDGPIHPCQPGRLAPHGTAHRWFPRSLLFNQQVRHLALPLRHRHSYAVDLHHDLPTQTCATQPEVPHHHQHNKQTNNDGCASLPSTYPPDWSWSSFLEVSTPVSRVYLPVSLTEPGPSGSTGPTRLCRGCSHPPRRPPDPAAASFTRPLRRPGDEGIPPPFEPTAPRGAPQLE